LNRKLLFLLLLFPAYVWSGPRYRLARWGVSPGNYSGITSLGDGRYAVVSDKDTEVAFHIWEIEMDSVSGRLLDVHATGRVVSPSLSGTFSRDAEGIAFCPQRGTVFVSGEADQRIVEYRVDGLATGSELPVPGQFDVHHIQPNRGFEALGYDSLRRVFWTCVESPVKNEPEEDRLPLLQFRLKDTPGFGLFEFEADSVLSYPLSPAQSKGGGRDYYHGVVAITPLYDGTLLVLEREARITRSGSGSRCWVRLFRFWPQSGQKAELGKWNSRFTPFNTRFANYEGMCLGPRLTDGRQTVLLISDSQGGYGRGPWHLRDYLRVFVLPSL
jgi:hypothetical protein